MVTPVIKDKILEFLVNSCPEMQYSGDLSNFSNQFSQPEEVINQILKQFDRRGLIKYQPFMGGDFFTSIYIEAHDYVLSGGHVGEFEIMDLELNKLKTEILSLEKNMDKNKFDKLTTSINTIVNFFAAANAKAFG